MNQDQATFTILDFRNSGFSWEKIALILEVLFENGAISGKSGERLNDAYKHYRDIEGRYGTLYPVQGKDY